MTVSELARPTSPYLLETVPTSNGRVLLAVGFAHYCVLHWGFSGQEVAAAFTGPCEDHVGRRVRMAADLLGGVLSRGLVRGWARPFGGGEPAVLHATAWELDDFTLRFATSAIDPKRPFDTGALPTHWIFVDRDDWNLVLEDSVKDVVIRPPKAARAKAATPPSAREVDPDPCALTEDRLVRLPEVQRRTGLSRSTIYRKIEAGRFPQQVPLSDNLVAWRERQIASWIAEPR